MKRGTKAWVSRGMYNETLAVALDLDDGAASFEIIDNGDGSVASAFLDAYSARRFHAELGALLDAYEAE